MIDARIEFLAREAYLADTQEAIQEALRTAIREAKDEQWLPIESAPKDEGVHFLVRLPGNSMADEIVFQVSLFEGQMYPDFLDGAIDWNDRITTATHWLPKPATKGL